MLGSDMNLVTTVVGFCMSTTFIVFFCVRLICGRTRSSSAGSRPANFDSELHSGINLYEHSIEGLDPVALAAIPTLKYNKETFMLGEDAQCTICLSEYQEKEILRIMPTCGHNFHLSCIDIWLQQQSTCPICRLSLIDLCQGKSHAAQPINRHELSRAGREMIETV